MGMASLRVANVPDIVTGLEPDMIRQEVEAALPDIYRILTTPAEGCVSAPVELAAPPASIEQFQGMDQFEALRDMNTTFLKNQWGDGFPVEPPTRQAVEAMLTGTSRNPQEVIAVIQPGFGVATVEKIAINAVMAGCRQPACLRVLIAAVQAITSSTYPIRSLASSSGPYGAMLVINGPIAKELEINSGRCAMGPGYASRVNTALGRAMRLILMNIAHAYPGTGNDPDTIGSARKYSQCVAENEAASPWEPFHVENGFGPNTSTVTILCNRGEVDASDEESDTAEGVLDSIAYYSCVPQFGAYMVSRHGDNDHRPHIFVLMAPEHAELIARHGGWSKQAVRTYLHNQAKMPTERYLKRLNKRPEILRPEWRWVLKADPNTWMPMVESADYFHILVVGAHPGTGRSIVMHGFLPVTKEIGD